MKRILLLILFFPSALSGLFSFPENSEARLLMREFITAPRSDVLGFDEKIIDQYTDSSRVRFEIQVQNGSFYILFINELNNRFPIYSPGTYIIKRNLSDGKFVQIKVFLKADEGCYIRFYPFKERTMMEIYLYGKRIYYDINLPLSFADVLTESINEIMRTTSAIVNWDIILGKVEKSIYMNKIEIANKIIENIPYLKTADDGAIDFNGKYVFIEDLSPQPKNDRGLNCSGFVKWVADGIYYAETGRYMSIDLLKKKYLSYRGNRWSKRNEDERDPYFGLDWTRNIALSIADAQTYTENGYNFADVRGIPWFRYVPDIGYNIDDLKLIMYYLAINELEYIYLASVNVSWGKEPILQQHIHTAVLIPVISSNNEFIDYVFESNSMTDAESLSNQYPNAQIHLTRIKIRSEAVFPKVNQEINLEDKSFFRR